MTEWPEAMRAGDKVSRRVDLADDRIETLTVTVDARRGDQVWQVPVRVAVPNQRGHGEEHLGVRRVG
jgi:hypothetical protein